MAASREQIAHILRRTTFGPFPGQVESYDGLSVDDVISRVLNTTAQELAAPNLDEGNDDRYGELVNWWPRAMRNDQAGLHEKMTFFWHGLVTSSINKCDIDLVFTQHQILRRHALGNVRALLQEVTIDAAMLQYLDGNGSRAEAPNENYSRELMELFALGRQGGYTEADVRSGAKALAGYSLDYEHGRAVVFNPESALSEPVSFLGRDVLNAQDVVNAVVDHESCAAYIADKIHHFFCGTAPSDERRAQLGQRLRDNDMEVGPVVEAVLRDETFMDSMHNRARTPVEWACTASRFLGTEIDAWALDQMGMQPFKPPNVAGWPPGARWFSTGAVFSWVSQTYDKAWDTEVVDTPDLVALVAARAGIFELSEATRTSIDTAISELTERRARASMAHMLIAASPEFVTA
jgi:uncharacterized protein (DUF1800 family)